jgi:hypothetical protein
VPVGWWLVQVFISDGVVVNACPVGNPVLSLRPHAAAALVFTALHQVRQQRPSSQFEMVSSRHLLGCRS